MLSPGSSMISPGLGNTNLQIQKPGRLIQDDRTFFCSELVAKAFKTLALIEDDETSCTKFYPSHFTSTGDDFLKLKEGTSLEVEKEIELEMFYKSLLPMEAQMKHL